MVSRVYPVFESRNVQVLTTFAAVGREQTEHFLMAATSLKAVRRRLKAEDSKGVALFSLKMQQLTMVIFILQI